MKQQALFDREMAPRFGFFALKRQALGLVM
jgi:hypothetical protein